MPSGIRRPIATTTLALAIALVTAGFSPRAAPPEGRGLQCRPRAECCKVCSRGRACGNSCISPSKTCHKGRGCACDADEICD